MALNLSDLFKWVKPSKRKDNVIFYDFEEGSGNHVMVRGKYNTWDSSEIALIKDKIRTAIRKSMDVYLPELREFMPYRSPSSIRCKVREHLIRLGVKHIGTTTIKKTKGKKNATK